MAEDLELIRAILHPTDYPKAVLEAIPQTVVGEDSVQPWRIENTRILAIVAHKDARRVSEEGSLFICTSPTDTGQDVEIESVYPLTLDFSISVGQVKSMTSELSGASTKEVGFSLVINPGKKMESELDMEEKDMTFLTRDVKSLRHFLTECRGLINSEDSVDLSPEFEWLLRYTSDRVMPRWFGHTPEDLRLVNEPLNTRLSPATAGLSGDDMADFRLIRDDWVLAQARQMSNNAQHTLRVRLGTFNVNGQLPSQDLSSWITSSPSTSGLTDSTKGPGAASSRSSISSSITKGDVNNLADLHSDLLVLGFQELDLSTEALVYSTGTAREDAWCQAIFAALGDKRDEYEKLVSKQLVGMLIIILVKKSLRSCFSNVSTSVAGAGIMGVMGNKGGVAIHLAFTPPVPGTSEVTSPGPTILTFVNSHLAAFDEMYEKRNLDFQDLSKRLKFVSQLADETASTSVRVTAYESDVLFWMADLNYRIEIPDEDVRRILACETWQGRFEMLLQHDQLKKASRTGRAFTGFIEHPISYPPTYRFGSTLEKDELGYDIKRKPAYTDRILHMGGRNVAIQQLSYTRHPQIMMSDHRPVAANFLLDVNVYDSIVYKETCQKLYKSVARMHEFSRRLLKLDKTSVDLGSISYKNVTSRTINITNLGKGPCAYRFLPPGLDSNVHPEWLHIEPMQAIILPGESVQLTLSPNVNSVMAKLNLGKKDLEATLILHTLMGKDHFITVTAEYQYTCFANQLSRLTQLPGPVRSVESPDDLLQEGPVNAPREIMRLVNWLMSDHITVEDGLFASPAVADENIINTIRECLDTGEEFPFTSGNVTPSVSIAFGETLIRFLDSLVEPVVPFSLQSKCIQMTSRDEAFELLDAFPPVSVNVWISITAFLHYICQTPADKASEQAKRLSMIFAPILLRDDPESSAVVSPLGKQRFLAYFIT